MTKIRADFAGDVHVIVDDQSNVCMAYDGQNRFCHRTNFIGRGFFGAELDQIRAAVAKLLCNNFRRAAMEIGSVNEGIKPAIRERFHANNYNRRGAEAQRKINKEAASKNLRKVPKLCQKLRRGEQGFKFNAFHLSPLT